MAVITLGSATVGRAMFQPGWRWSESVKPLVGTESCDDAAVSRLNETQALVATTDFVDLSADRQQVAEELNLGIAAARAEPPATANTPAAIPAGDACAPAPSTRCRS